MDTEQRIAEGRRLKAAAIAAVFVELGASPEQVRTLPRDKQLLAARIARQRDPSETTWELVVSMVEVAQKRKVRRA